MKIKHWKLIKIIVTFYRDGNKKKLCEKIHNVLWSRLQIIRDAPNI